MERGSKMNTDCLHELIDAYYNSFDRINSKTNNEVFKWAAMKHFRNVWFASDAENRPFHELLKDALKEASVLLNNGIVTPASGIVKIAEIKPEEAEHLFRKVLLADDSGDISVRQNNMEKFTEGMNGLKEQTFPTSYKYKQDRHAASCYLFFVQPEENYIYRYTEAMRFEETVNFGLSSGRGQNFSLPNYYSLCDTVVEALREHDDLLQKYSDYLGEDCRSNASLHLMTFDLIYCSLHYGWHPQHRKQNRKAQSVPNKWTGPEPEVIQKEIQELELKRDKIDEQISKYESISLVGVKVDQKNLGTGYVIDQIMYHNQGKDQIYIKVHFESRDVTYLINDNFSRLLYRPRFEDDAALISTLIRYGELSSQRTHIEAEIQKKQKQLGQP